MTNKNYTIGLDIGTNSVGYAVLSDDYRVFTKKMKVLGNTDKKYIKKNLIGTLMFESGETAAERRMKRTARRRYTRRANRLAYLRDIFAAPISKVDMNFFARLDESDLISADKKHVKQPIFGTIEEEVAYHHNFPTIYHLRRELAENKTKADLRLVYLALAHIIKYRGNFLYEGELNTKDMSVEQGMREFIQEYNKTFSDQANFSPLEENTQIHSLLTEDISKGRKVENVLKAFPKEKLNGRFAQFVKLMVGNLANFKNHLPIEEDAKLQLSSEKFEDDLEQLLATVGDDYAEVFVHAKKVYNAIVLSSILSEADVNSVAKLSQSMEKRYKEHQKDLESLKQYVKANVPDRYKEIFSDATKDGYAGYIESGVTEERFYVYLKKLLAAITTESSDKQYFIERIEAGKFLRKQRTFDNGAIPHQVHLEELRAIIRNQSAHYPFLAENQEKIEKILTFRIPYYVGPLAKGESEFAWLTRKDRGQAIRPWNFDEIVDIEKSAIDFIERMTKNDTYLPNEKGLPKQSLIYQQYMIFNELTKVTFTLENNVSVFLTGKQKQAIFQNLFKKNRKVTRKQLINFLEAEEQLSGTEIKGIEDKFNASYSTYHDLAKIEQLREMLDANEHTEMFEEIVRILTVFDDAAMISNQLQQRYGDILTRDTIKKLSRKKYTGWGSLSRKLIHGIRDRKTQKTILDFLVEDDRLKGGNRNFMQLINDSRLSFKEEIENARTEALSDDLHETVAGLAGSPAIKRGILQSLKIVDELVRVMGYPPGNIVIEMARENQTTSKGRTRQRLKTLETAIKELGSNILKEYPVTQEQLQSERLYLYYLQNGKDLYTGKDLDIGSLHTYDVDHIIPQSLVKDDSIDNKVLTTQKTNRGKSGYLPSIDVIRKMEGTWRHLLKSGLISQKKYDNLTKGELTDEDKARFVNRQLVETRQITKHVAQILDQRYNSDKENKDVRIILMKSLATSRFREQFELYKVRELNDFHHAHDAYLNGVVALSLLKVYPSLAPRFVYGEYQTTKFKGANKATEEKKFNENILKFFNKESKNKSGSAEQVWDRSYVRKQVEKVIYHSKINIVKKTEIQKGRFYKETVKPKGKGQLIERKRGRNPEHYGGYVEPLIAYTLLVTSESEKNKKQQNKFLGIRVLEREEFEKDAIKFLERQGYRNVSRIAKLPKYTLFELENGRRRLLASASELQKGNQLKLPKELVKLLYHAKRCDEVNYPDSYRYVVEHRHQFEDFLQHIESFECQFVLAEGNMKKINKIYAESRDTDDIKLLSQSFINVLNLVTMGAPSAFRFFGQEIPRKRYTSINECLKGTLIYQSITGLFETRIKLGD